ncbi:MAG: hypothetical protein DI539_06020 [Flavobacterium psychrophilum]|nr:MAG: hypothetical protein DI539_06020 [Flavobacterium psychrophilum]
MAATATEDGAILIMEDGVCPWAGAGALAGALAGVTHITVTAGATLTVVGAGVAGEAILTMAEVTTMVVAEAITTTHDLQHIMPEAEDSTMAAAEPVQEQLMLTAEAHTITETALTFPEAAAEASIM